MTGRCHVRGLITLTVDWKEDVSFISLAFFLFYFKFITEYKIWTITMEGLTSYSLLCLMKEKCFNQNIIEKK